MRILTIVDLQEEFDSFTRRAQVIKNVTKLVKEGSYDYIVNLMYGGGSFGYDRPSRNIPEIRQLLRGRKNVLKATKDDDGGGNEVITAVRRELNTPNNRKKPRKTGLRSTEIDVVGVNTPYCVAETIFDFLHLGIKANNIRIHKKAVSERNNKRHKRERKIVLEELKEKGVQII